jgi:hypothetical protein
MAGSGANAAIPDHLERHHGCVSLFKVSAK